MAGEAPLLRLPVMKAEPIRLRNRLGYARQPGLLEALASEGPTAVRMAVVGGARILEAFSAGA